MRYVFVVNPCAGHAGNVQAIRDAVAKLPQKDDCEIYETTGVGDATVFVRRYAAEHPGETRFIACGGDGTINEVFNGAVGLSNVSVTCYPCGSGNDFVKCFGGKEAFLDIQKLLDAPAKPLDLLKIGERYCVNVCNFGFDTTVARTMNNVRSKPIVGGGNAYTTGIVTALFTAMKNECTVIADGEQLNDGKILLCTVANGQYVGGAFRCAPRAKCDDGLIEVCLVRPISRLRFVKLLTPYTNGNHLDDPNFSDIITYRQAKVVEIKAPEGFAYSLDGEIIYDPHFTVEMVPHAISFAAPKAEA